MRTGNYFEEYSLTEETHRYLSIPYSEDPLETLELLK